MKQLDAVKKQMAEKFPNIQCHGRVVVFEVNGELVNLSEEKLVLLSRAVAVGGGKRMGAAILEQAEGVSEDAAAQFMEYLEFSIKASLVALDRGEQGVGGAGGEVQSAPPAGTPAPTNNGVATTH